MRNLTMEWNHKEFILKSEKSKSSDLYINQLEKPQKYKVIIYNDNFTSKDFVIAILESVYHKDYSEALALANQASTKGFSIVDTFMYDIANTKSVITTNRARNFGYPLRCEVEIA